ncbi:MAG: amidohydrolase [Cyanobacteria bacterium HKST-UBA02]|nr:amidohydrolase [Cyanobacteria bacterium HKST-UBA02]
MISTGIEDVLSIAGELGDEIVEWRRYLHSIPEESFKENGTASFLAEKLASFGYKVTGGLAETGLIADLGSGRTVALRAEMDGLPIQEQNRLAFNSTNPGLMHACGHDDNMACVLAAASILSRLKPEGRVRILMQPSSEKTSEVDRKSGSNKMIEAGALADVDALISLHVDSTIRGGEFGILSDPVKDRQCRFEFVIAGASGTKNCGLKTGAALILDALAEVEKNETYRPLFAIESLVSSDKEAVLTGCFRYLGRETHDYFKKTLSGLAEALEGKGIDARLSIESAGVLSRADIDLARVVSDVVQEVSGRDCQKVSRQAWSEDFTPYSSSLPATLLFLGAAFEGQTRVLHTPTFDFDETRLANGAAVLALSVLHILRVSVS